VCHRTTFLGERGQGSANEEADLPEKNSVEKDLSKHVGNQENPMTYQELQSVLCFVTSG